MMDPKRLSEKDVGRVGSALLEAGRRAGPSPAARRKALAALELAAGAAATATALSLAAQQTQAAASATAATTATVVSPAATASAVGWFATGVGKAALLVSVGMIAGGGVLYQRQLSADRPVPTHKNSVSSRGAPAPLPQPTWAPKMAANEAEGVAVESIPPVAPVAERRLARRVRVDRSPQAAVTFTPSIAAEVASLDAVQKALRRNEIQEALKQIALHKQKYQATPLAPEAELLEIDVFVAAGQTSEAAARARAFLLAHPQSPHGIRVRNLAHGAQGP